MVDQEGYFNFRTYFYNPQGIRKALLFKEQEEEISLVPREDSLVEAQTLLAIVAPILLSTKLETGEIITVQNNYRVLKQKG